MSKFISRLYQLSSNNSNVNLIIEFGPMQHAVTSIMLNDNVIANNQEDKINIVIGNCGELKDKVLFCTSTVISNSKDADITTVTYHLTGGTVQLTETLEEVPSNRGEIVIYTAEFMFY